MAASTKTLYEETVASQIKVWDDEIEHLDARADILMAQIEDRYYTMIRELRNREKELKEELSLLKATDDRDEHWLAARDRLLCDAQYMKDAICRAIEEISIGKLGIESRR